MTRMTRLFAELASLAAKGSGHLVARAGIDGIQQCLTALESAKVFAEKVDDIVPMFRTDPGGVRGDDDMGESPERALPIQRFAFENIQNGAAKPAILKSGDKSRLIDDFPARNIDENGAAIKQGKLIRAYQTIRFRNRRGTDNQHIAPVQRFVQTVRAEDTLDERRNRLLRPAADGRHPHIERVRAPRHFLSDGTEAQNRHVAPVKTPRPGITRQVILYPTPLSLSSQHQMESPGKNQKTTHHVLGYRNSLNAPGVGDHNAARRQFIQGKNPHRSRR